MKYMRKWSESVNFKTKRPVKYLGIQKQLLSGEGNWRAENLELFIGPNCPIYGVEGVVSNPKTVFVEDKSCLDGVPMCEYESNFPNEHLI